MIERPMPQDVMKYKAKLLGNLSGRQCLAIIGCVAVIAPSYFLFGSKVESIHIKIFISALPALPIFIIGFMPIMGLPAEKVGIPMIVDNFIAPAIRKKEIHYPEYEKWKKLNYDQLQEYNKKLKAELEKEGASLENINIEIEDEEDTKKGKKKKKKNDKFKVTKSSEYKGIK